MENRYRMIKCSNCGKEMHEGVTVQGYNHPLVWSPGKHAITYPDVVKLSYSKSEKLKGLRRFTSRFRTKPSYFPAWYCEECGLMTIDIKPNWKRHKQCPGSAGAFCFRRKTTTRYAGEPEEVLLMRRKRKPPMIEW